MIRVVFLNALPLNAFTNIVAEKIRFTVKWHTAESLKERLKEVRRAAPDIVCENYIRHPATRQLLGTYLKILDGCADKMEYTWAGPPGDVIFVVTLRKPARGQEVTQVTLDDLIIAEVRVEP